MTLEEALAALNLEPGKTYHTHIRGQRVKVAVAVDDDAPSVADEGMIEPWTVLPMSETGRPVIARHVPADPVVPPIIPDDEESGS